MEGVERENGIKIKIKRYWKHIHPIEPNKKNEVTDNAIC